MSTEPTGREHLTPVEITDTSATERGGFRKCRRQWFLTQVHRLQSSEDSPNFWLGNLFHHALEIYYRNIMIYVPHDVAANTALDAYQTAFDSSFEKMGEEMGRYFWERAKDEWRRLGELGFEMARDYFDREKLDPIFDEIVMVEDRVAVPILDPGGNKVGNLSVKTDLIGRNGGRLGVADHKTANRDPNAAHLDMDDQLTAEVYSTWKHLGEFPDEAIYNVALKKVAQPPRLLKGGKLSQDKAQQTSSELYRQAIRDNGLNIMDYIEFVQFLEDREAQGDDRFFVRERTYRTMDQMEAFERDLFQEFADMYDVALDPVRAYPNPSMMNCPRCPVRNICITIQDGGDVEAVIKANFVVGEPRR